MCLKLQVRWAHVRLNLNRCHPGLQRKMLQPVLIHRPASGGNPMLGFCGYWAFLPWYARLFRSAASPKCHVCRCSFCPKIRCPVPLWRMHGACKCLTYYCSQRVACSALRTGPRRHEQQCLGA